MKNNQFNDQSSGILATCLSQENISVIHTRSNQASFDEINRILRLPSTKVNADKNVTIGLTLHEVGHALYTTSELRELLTEKNISFNLVNIIEDIRIEKLIKRKYKGASRIMTRSHLSLFKTGFFGTKKDIIESGALSVLNAYYKVGASSGLTLDPAFKDIYPIIDNMETIHDVIEVCELLEKKDEEIKNDKKEDQEQNGLEETNEDKEESKEFGDDNESTESTESESDDDKESTESESESDDDKESTESDDDKESTESDNDKESTESTESDDDKESTESESTESESTESDDDDKESTESESESTTGANIKSNGLGDGESQTEFEDKISNDIYNDLGNFGNLPIVVENTTPEIKVLRDHGILIDTKEFHDNIEFAVSKSHIGYNGNRYKRCYEEYEESYPPFLSEIKRTVNHMSNAFNRMKSAKEWSRTKTHDKGTLNLRKLHQYKYSDNIFNTGQSISKGKNHGIVMLIDYSHSMRSVIQEELKQIIITALFARKVGIPFEAYSFTVRRTEPFPPTYERSITPKINLSTFNDTGVVELINSSLGKKDFDKAIFNLYMSSKTYVYNGYSLSPYIKSTYEKLSGTPLVPSLLIIERVIGDFVKKHNIEIPTFILITDGAGTSINTDYIECGKIVGITENNKVYEKSTDIKHRYECVSQVEMVNNMIKQKYNANIVGYFIGSNNTDLKSGKKLYNIPHKDMITIATINKKGFIKRDIASFDQYFFISGKEIKAENISDNTSIANIKKSFRKNSKAAVNSRVFVNEVISIIAKAA